MFTQQKINTNNLKSILSAMTHARAITTEDVFNAHTPDEAEFDRRAVKAAEERVLELIAIAESDAITEAA